MTFQTASFVSADADSAVRALMPKSFSVLGTSCMILRISRGPREVYFRPWTSLGARAKLVGGRCEPLQNRLVAP
jgi:hypothetical protein